MFDRTRCQQRTTHHTGPQLIVRMMHGVSLENTMYIHVYTISIKFFHGVRTACNDAVFVLRCLTMYGILVPISDMAAKKGLFIIIFIIILSIMLTGTYILSILSYSL